MEYVKVIATVEILNMESFQCSYCLENSSEERRKGFGCGEIREKQIIPIRHYGQSINFFTCPGNYFDQEVNDLIFIKEQFDKGIMPYGGSLMDQPAKFIEAIKLINVTQAKIKEEQRVKPKPIKPVRSRRGK